MFQRIEKAVRKESETRESRFLKGIERYKNSKFVGPQLSEPTTILEGDHCRLRLYHSGNRKRAEKRPLLLAIPSLVNKYYILDLMPQTSLVQHFNRQDFDVALIEWAEPVAEDAAMGVEDYTLCLLHSLQQHWEAIDRPILGLGYCLGGVIATALASLFPMVKGLILLATPWDFSQYSFARMQRDQRQSLERKIKQQPLFASEHVQSLCYLANAARVIHQYSEFSESNNMRGEMNFVAIQHWANDGVDVTRRVAEQCLIEWPLENPLMHGEWEIEGLKIWPSELEIPTFSAIPTRDNIVPYNCAITLADQLKHGTLITPASGHVGMVAGIEQSERLYIPLLRWTEQF